MIGRIALLVLVLALVAVGCGGEERQGALVEPDPTADDFDYDYDIPPGSGDRLDAGEDVEILPRQLEVSVGEVMRIINRDDRDHLIGPFFVGAGETLVQRFAAAGEFEGLCTVHPSGEFILHVSQ